MSEPTYSNNAIAAVKIPEYRSLLAGRFCFITALRMLGTLVGWWMYELTNAPLAIGLIGLAEVIPALSLALYAGHVIDVSEKRKLLLKGIFGYLCCSLLLLLISTRYFNTNTTKTIVIAGIYTVIFISGIIRAFAGPIFGAIIGQMVPRVILQNAITWNQGTYLSASVVGHASAGFCIALFGNTGTLGIVAGLLSVALFMLSKIKSKPAASTSVNKRTWESVREGLNFVYNTKEVLGALSLDLFAVLFGGAVAMIPVYARDILHVGPIGFGWLNAATDFGSILMVITLTIFPLKTQQGKKLLFVVAGFGLCIIVFAISKIFWISFAALFVSGLLDAISVVVRGTIVQLKTPDEMRGRVMSVNSMFINSSNELGQFESGVMAKLLGVVRSVIFGGTMTLLVVIITWFKAPTLRKMEY
ncbi:MFS transporter [Segetibacter aerophilus]|uniref:MFS transporter n=1 Tax=Segetibacter aerophilus TaxID=670293 RepID=A0A512BH68_9BACT|nr:MFS transporter [Segetibacter aerophilus]GEO11299.1 MFS transporter [Segetibacter aerophilus]